MRTTFLLLMYQRKSRMKQKKTTFPTGTSIETPSYDISGVTTTGRLTEQGQISKSPRKDNLQSHWLNNFLR